ncbi:hypothetical protein B2G71_01110 [Novosphingobium sp. PC22D]|uniref:glycosyltransferase n=1 Tax=Novosphingobium sp. PC22D TaxID=1962403 RepID=UPI000BEF7D71|nr:glycosyltransferase [Novosphingobium sp. PC22D]PEQ14237.1 hypothetical protein B2G71_01110 [Novosphingobium sp. PC22D]
MTAQRIFWLGSHKVLNTTELPLLRAMGYEVFNPPYLSDVFDQSIHREPDLNQPTTLPREIFAELMAFNFFYAAFTPRITEIVNAFFDAVVVTISEHWLKSMLDSYEGRIIYRTYGQHFVLSEVLCQMGLWPKIVERDDFAIVPFAAESIENEQQWFRDRCTEIVPYQIPDEVFAHSRQWGRSAHLREEIATSIPNIENPYYAHAYSAFAAEFPHRVFRIYGPQRSIPADGRIVGALSRHTFLDRLATAKGYFYNYRDRVCYLPPIEFMEIGGPVLFRPGSLLARFFDDQAPGQCADRLEAELKMRRLLDGDRAFVDDVLAAQEPVRRRYDRAHVVPRFREAFSRLLSPEGPAEPACETTARAPSRQAAAAAGADTARLLESLDARTPRVFILLHVDGLFGYVNGRAYAFEGIPRVVDLMVRALCDEGDAHVCVTATRASQPVVQDFFADAIAAGRLSILALETEDAPQEADMMLARLALVEAINADLRATDRLIVPHYYLFPEALLATCETIIYLPDYFPHLMPDQVFDVSADKDRENLRIGQAIAKRSRAILTNSQFTRGYLPDAGFLSRQEDDKVVVAPLPLMGKQRVGDVTPMGREMLRESLGGRPFLFYPTANRPNKQFRFLLQVFERMRAHRPDLTLVLTGSLHSVPGVHEFAVELGVLSHITFLSRIDESAMRYLYERARALILTSTLEGNFPPQVLEAMEYGAPVVATRLPTIVEICGKDSDKLLLCAPLDIEDFVAKLEFAISQRDEVLRRQRALHAILARRNSLGQFRESLLGALGLAHA